MTMVPLWPYLHLFTPYGCTAGKDLGRLDAHRRGGRTTPRARYRGQWSQGLGARAGNGWRRDWRGQTVVLAAGGGVEPVMAGNRRAPQADARGTERMREVPRR
jgi:hypothetical protein